MDKDVRNRIQSATQAARRLLEEEYAQQLEGKFDIRLDGTVAADPGSHLTDEERVLRAKLVEAVEHRQASGVTIKEAVEGYLREASFTTLNRFVALKMLEARDLVLQCVSRGEESKGFKEYSALAPGLVQDEDKGYRIYIESIFDEIGREVGVLFDRRDPASLLWPRRQTLLDLLGILNTRELSRIWERDETIGWVYQYFNTDEDREKARYDDKGRPKAPQNSYELAVRNQFFTPRYVVEFLTDNTLGRMWYEMQQGKTRLIDECKYLVRRPVEHFLAKGHEPPPEDASQHETPSHEELLARPTYVPFRPKKDPRDLSILDPACGSGHFLLYAFDVFMSVYEEAWRDENTPPSERSGKSLRDDYATIDDLRRTMPALILRHNLHGIDIDPRAAQIGALAIWMRAQRTYNEFGIPRDLRPPIRKSNIVVAESMPGETGFQEEFIDSLGKKLGSLLGRVFQLMKKAGRAGPLLKIEDEIQVAIREIYGDYGDLFREQDRDVWLAAETDFLTTLRDYARRTQDSQTYRRRLFAEDAEKGFSFISACRRKYDVIVMNPPFGDTSEDVKSYLGERYRNSRQDLFATFIERAFDLAPHGLVGCITPESALFRRTLEPWRRKILLKKSTVSVLAQLGGHVLDGAIVRTACYTMVTPRSNENSLFIRVLGQEAREDRLRAAIRQPMRYAQAGVVFATPQSEFQKLPYAVFGYWCSPQLRNTFALLEPLEGSAASVRQGLATADDFRFLRLRWEVLSDETNCNWSPFAKGGEYSPFHNDVHLMICWQDEGSALSAFSGSVIRNQQDYSKHGLTYPLRTAKRFAPRALPANCLFGHKGPAIVDVRGSNWALLALLNSRVVSYLLSLSLGMAESEGGAGANSYEVGLLQKLPVPGNATLDTELERLARLAWAVRAEADLRDETTSIFRSPVAPFKLTGTIRDVARQLSEHLTDLSRSYRKTQIQIDQRVRELYQLTSSDWQDVEGQIEEVHEPANLLKSDFSLCKDVVAEILQFLVGVSFGRWDANELLLDGPEIASVDPFAAQESTKDYSDKRPHILTEDFGHHDDIIGSIDATLHATHGKRAQLILAEAAQILDLSDNEIRVWLRFAFFKRHLKTYSKSRRKAPVYWQLAPASVSYSVWLYYHRLGRDSFYNILNDHLTPKLRHERRKLASLEQEAGPNWTSSQRREIANQEAFVEELRIFRIEVELIAPLWNPKSNDGVIINFAPLWRLVPHHKPWQKECKACWDTLVAGDYDWAHLAMHLWPERVVPKCADDRSLAIAHDLEDVFWVEDESGKWQRRDVDQATVDGLVDERTSPAVKEALENLLNAPAPVGGRRGRRKKS